MRQRRAARPGVTPLLVAALGLLSAESTAAKQPCSVTREDLASARLVETTVRAAMPELMRRHALPGAAVALIANGRLRWTAGYGIAVPDKGIPVSPETVFQAGSMTVPVTAWTVLRLVEQGRVDLDRPIEKYLKGRRLPATAFDVSLVTPRGVLSHTAGLSIPAYGGFGPKQTLQSLDQSLRGALDAGDEPVAVAEAPGRGFAYSAGGYALAELLVRQMRNEQFSSVAEREILSRLAMYRSALPDRPNDSKKVPRLAVTYDDTGQRAPARAFSALGAAGLQTTAPDYAKLVAAMMPGPCNEPLGRGALGPRMVAAAQTPQPDTGNALLFAGSEYGLGLAVKALPDSGHRLLYHPGDNPPNWHGLFMAVPERRAGLVVLTSAAGGEDLRLALACTWLGALGETLPAECAGAR